MGSSESKSESKAYNEKLLRQKAHLEEEKLRWQQQQIREQFWKESQLREEQKRKEALLEWQRQAELKSLQLEQQNIQREVQKLNQLKVQQQFEESPTLLQQDEIRRKQQSQQAFKTAVKDATLRASSGIRETVALQQRVSTGPSSSSSSSSIDVPRATVAAQKKVSPGSAASLSSSIVPKTPAAARQKVLPTVQPTAKNLPKPLETPKSYVTRMHEANVKCEEWSIIDYIKDENFISKQVSANLLKLFNDENTIPFIAKYRRHLTQGMNENKLREAWHSYNQAKLIKQRAVATVKDIDNRGLWTPEFHALVHETKSLHDLEHIYSVFKTPKSKFVKTAIINGLGIVADACLTNQTPPLTNFVQESVEGLKTLEQVKDGIVCILADIIVKDRGTFSIIKKLRVTHQFKIQTTKGKGADKLKNHENVYGLYYNFTLSERDLKPDQVRDINKGEALKALSVKINIPEVFERDFKKQRLQQYGFVAPGPQRTLIDAAIDFAYNRSIKGAVAKKVRKEISDKAQKALDEDFAQNVKLHLLTPPVRGKVVLGLSPGFQNGCKFAVISEQGDVLATGTIYPYDANNPRGKIEAERELANVICKHKCTIIALADGDASKETQDFLTHMIKKNKKIPSDVFYTIVDKSSASIYSCGRKAKLEFPDLEPEILSAVSIARRLQDPMAELVKIEPEQLPGDEHQQEMRRQLIVELVSYVGVDVNAASMSLLKNVAGLNEAKANSIIEWRRSSGPFTNRNDLLKVKGINQSTFKQCVGFIRIVPETAVVIGGQEVPQDSFNYLDQTWIHPESYDIAMSFLEAAKCNVLQLGTRSFIFTVNLYAQTGYPVLAKRFGTTKETIEMIVEGLRIGKGQDIRGQEDSTMFRRSVIRFNDLNNDDLLFGVVTHLATFGAFVDVGAEIDGLIHKSCMNGLTVKVDQKVQVRVSNIQKERGRLGLTLIQSV